MTEPLPPRPEPPPRPWRLLTSGAGLFVYDAEGRALQFQRWYPGAQAADNDRLLVLWGFIVRQVNGGARLMPKDSGRRVNPTVACVRCGLRECEADGFCAECRRRYFHRAALRPLGRPYPGGLPPPNWWRRGC